MSQPPRGPDDPVDPLDPADPVDPTEPLDRDESLDETVVRDGSLDETVVRDEWGNETVVGAGATVVPDEPLLVEEQEEVAERRAPLIWPYLLAFLVLVLAGLGAYWYFSQEDTNTVPAVVGQLEPNAEASVREAGFEPRSEPEESERPVGVVLEQSPEGGTELEEGKTVVLSVSSGPAEGAVPDVVGEQTDDAVAAVEEAGFEAKVTEVFADEEEGIVVEQDPAAGGNLREGATVELSASKGREPVEVPDVVGTTSSEATAALRDAGLEANLVSVPSRRPAGTVIAQNPRAGSTVDSGSSVRLNVSQSPGTTTTTTTTTEQTTTAPEPTPAPGIVPDAVGQELSEGARAFGDEGLKVAVSYVPSQEAQGTIVAQAQAAGTELQRGDTVQVNVSNGADPAAATAVPDVVGETTAAARSQLDDAGFEVLAIEVEDSGSEEGTVLSQTPAGGASVPGGSLVILYVSAG